jgi:hypothetical protein
MPLAPGWLAMHSFSSPLVGGEELQQPREAQSIVGENSLHHLALCRKYRECRKIVLKCTP